MHHYSTARCASSTAPHRRSCRMQVLACGPRTSRHSFTTPSGDDTHLQDNKRGHRIKPRKSIDRGDVISCLPCASSSVPLSISASSCSDPATRCFNSIVCPCPASGRRWIARSGRQLSCLCHHGMGRCRQFSSSGFVLGT
jgi:hypothetical protein